MDEDPLVRKGLGEGVVLLLGLGRPHHVVEEQGADVVRCEAGQFEPGPVDDGLAQLADLGADGEGHDVTSVATAGTPMGGWSGTDGAAGAVGPVSERAPTVVVAPPSAGSDSGGRSTGSLDSPRRCRRAFRKA